MKRMVSKGSERRTVGKPRMKNRLAPEVEEVVLKMAYEYPPVGCRGLPMSYARGGYWFPGGGVRSIWLGMVWRPLGCI